MAQAAVTAAGYRGELPPRSFNLARYCLERSTRTTPDKTALIVAGAGEQELTYGALEDIVLRMAQGLRQSGLEPGARLLIRMAGSLDFALSFLAANAAGGVPVPASPMLTRTEAENLCADCGAKLAAADGSLEMVAGARAVSPDVLKQAPRGDYADTAADDPGFLVYTSGTSASPKGVLHAQRAAWGRRPMYRGWYGIERGDVVLHSGAFNWTYTLGTGLLDPWANGATAVVHAGPTNAALWQVLARRYGATIFASVPGIYRQMLRAGVQPMPSLRHGLTAGEALPLSIRDRWTAATGVELYEALGMSEISTYVSSSPDVPVRPGSPGKAQEGRCVIILEDGQIGVHRSDPGLLLGYWNRTDEEERAWRGDWFATGDLGRIDDDGYVWHEGRADDLMNAGGYRVSPLEVEAVLMQHPAVQEAGAAEIRVDGETSIIGAFVVPVSAIEEAALMGFARERLAAYKCPRQIWFRSALPRTVNGKLIRKALKP